MSRLCMLGSGWNSEDRFMSGNLKERSGDTVRLLRPPPRVFTDQCGNNVWMGEVEVLDLDLVQPENYDPYNSADVGNPWSRS